MNLHTTLKVNDIIQEEVHTGKEKFFGQFVHSMLDDVSCVQFVKMEIIAIVRQPYAADEKSSVTKRTLQERS